VAIAEKASPGKVLLAGWTVMLDCDDMVRFVGQNHVIFMKQAILASTMGPFADQSA
jgi:hypothetical protein